MHSSGKQAHTPAFDLRSARVRLIAGVVVGVAVVALLGQALLTSPRPSPTGPIGASSGSAPTSPSSSAGSSPGAPDEPWADLVLPPYVKLAELTPSDLDRVGVATNATFTLHSLGSTPAAALAAGLRIEPAIGIKIQPGTAADEVIVRPAAPLVEGTRYRFQLTAPDGSLAGAWAFIARSPLHVVATLPGDRSIRVPRNTGIEITFDQDGVTGVSDRVTIKPAVEGRIEAHGRTFAFVPAQPLAEATIYTVTVRAGIGLDGSTETLEQDVAFQFETGSGSSTAERIDFARPITEVRPKVAPVMALRSYGEDLPGTLRVAVDRLPDLAAAVDAAQRLAGAAGWAVASPQAVVDTTTLEHVTSVDAEVAGSESGPILLVPVHLGSGRYVLTIQQDTGPAQLLLLVTDLATYAAVGTETTIVWVNDLGTGTPVRASIAIVNGKTLGQTNADGLLRVDTPSALRAPTSDEDAPASPAHILTVRETDGRSTLFMLGLPYVWGYGGDGRYDGSWATDRWWTLFQSDRDTYRQTDTIHLWGLVRARSDRSVPTDVVVQLHPDRGGDGAPILRRALTLTARGTLTVDLDLVDLPRGSYSVDLVVEGSRIASAWIYVTEIRKPAYQIEVSADHDVYVAGSPAVLTARTTFYDGTAVPGLELRFSAFGQHANAATNAQGIATVTLPAGWEDGPMEDGASYQYISVTPAQPEEGEISGSGRAFVLPARIWLSGTGSVTNGRVVVDARLTRVDLAAYEAALMSGENVDVPPGSPDAGREVRATVTRLVVTHTQVGTTYDYISKTVVPQYEESTQHVLIGTYSLTSSPTGAVHLSVAIPDPDDDYEVALTASDSEKHSFVRTLWATGGSIETYWWSEAYLASTDPDRKGDTYAVGEAVSMTFHKADRSVPSGGRFLFIVARGGRLDASVQGGPTFERTFRDADLPGYTIRSAWVGANGFVVATGVVSVDVSSKRLKVSLTADRARYQPGDTVSISIRTTSPADAPVAADVIVKALDEKLYTLGQAFDSDPAWELMSVPPAGFVSSYASHATPLGSGDGMGDGGGGREEFRDSATFQRVTTDASGRATVRFSLPDDLTAWHVSATALSAQLDTGQASIVLPTGLSFFVDPVLAPEYLVGEQPVLRVRAYGEALTSGDTATFRVTAPELGVDATVSAPAFVAARVQLPMLPVGTHRITIAAQATRGATVLHDVLVRTVVVTPSRLQALASRIDPLAAGFAPTGGDGLTTYLITDAGRGSLITTLENLASSTGPRFDQAVAAEVARDLLIAEFGFDPHALPPSGYQAGAYEQQDAVALLPYSSGDLELTARAALTVPGEVSRSTIYAKLDDALQESTTTREGRIIALAGLAGIGENVLGELRAFDWRTTTLREQLWLALGLAASGDEDGARTVERAILEAQGERLGPWVRLSAGPGLETSRQATALLLLLAARIGDPLAADVARYLGDQPSKESLVSLELLAYAQSALDRLPRTAGRFAFTVDGKRTEVTLKPGASYTLVLTAAQRATLGLERLDGSLEVVTSWISSDRALPSDASLAVKRTVSPDGAMDGDGLVRVTLEVTFGSKVPDGCYRLTDLVPSGLAPIIGSGGYPLEDGNWAYGPYEVEGQRVSWCAGPRDATHVYTYRARVVSPGTYRWEPAVLQSAIAPSLGASTPETTYTIR